MKILPITPNHITLAAKILRGGGVVVYPTDTAYALGGLVDSPTVRKKIRQIKGRRDPKFTLIAADIKQVGRFFTLNLAQKKLAKLYWPGPLSLVVTKQYAVRVPAEAAARRLAQLAGRPLIATSANISGRATRYSARAVVKEFAGQSHQPDLILDAGRRPRVRPSTVVQIKRGQIVVLRPGPVKI